MQAAPPTFDQSANCWHWDSFLASMVLLRMCHRLVGGEAFFFLPCLPGDTGSGSEAPARWLRGNWGSFLHPREVLSALGFLCAAARLRLLRAREGSQAPESFPLPATDSPPRRDSQVGPVRPPSLPAAMAPATPAPSWSAPSSQAPGRRPAG